MRILIIGHSHTYALKLALEKGSINSVEGHEILIENVHKGDFPPIFLQPEHTDISDLKNRFKAFIKTADVIFTAFFGNAVPAFGMLPFPDPFDFVNRNDDKEIGLKGEVVIPKVIVESKIDAATNNFEAYLQALLGFVPAHIPVVQLQSPSITRSEKHIRENAHGYADRIAKRGVSPRHYHLRIYHAHSDIIRAKCSRAKVGYLPAPKSSVDSEGFLKGKYLFADVDHANEAYGKLVIEDILSKAPEIISKHARNPL